MSERQAMTHWVGENNNTLHGNGAGSKDMERTSGDEDDVTCSLCQSLLIRMHAERNEYAEPAMTPTQHPAPEVVALTEGEREALHSPYLCDCDDLLHCRTLTVVYREVESILADRLAAVQAERDEAVREERMRADDHARAWREVEALLAERDTARREADDLRARLGKVETRIRDLADEAKARKAAYPSHPHWTAWDLGESDLRDILRAALADPAAGMTEKAEEGA